MYTKRHFIALLLGFVDKDWNVQIHCLGFRLWEGSAEHFKLVSWKRGVLQEFGLDDAETFSNTSDAGSNMKKAFAEESADWQRCSAHNVNNACDDALGQRERKDPTTGSKVSTHPVAANFIAKIRKVVTYFRQSSVRMDAMKDEQKELYGRALKVISDHFIRWNSTERMMQRMLEVREALTQYFTKYDPQAQVQLPAGEWTQMANLIGVLGPVLQASTRLQEKNIMLSEAYGICRTLVKALQSDSSVKVPILTQKGECMETQHGDLDHVSRAVRERLLEQMERRFSDEELLTNPMLLALAIDPRTKNLRFLNPRQRKDANAALDAQWRLRTTAVPDVVEVEVVSDETLAETPKPKRQRTDFLSDFDFFDEIETAPAANRRKENELSRFRDLPGVPNKQGFSVLSWWQEHEETYPKLSGIARSILGARATSANIERIFSQARGLVSPQRTTMTEAHIELWMLNKLHRCLAHS